MKKLGFPEQVSIFNELPSCVAKLFDVQGYFSALSFKSMPSVLRAFKLSKYLQAGADFSIFLCFTSFINITTEISKTHIKSGKIKNPHCTL